MTRPLSMDIRERAMARLDAGETVDLPRICAAPSARLGHFAFEGALMM